MLSEKLCIKLSDFCRKLPLPRPETPKSTQSYYKKEVKEGKDFALKTKMNHKNKRILDLGCGYGAQTVYFALQKAELAIGLDLNRQNLVAAVAYSKQKQVDKKVDFIMGDARYLPLRNDVLEVIVTYHAFEHIIGVSKVMKECKRTLGYGCFMYIAFPSWFYPYAAHLWGYIPIPWCHFLFSERTLVNVVQEIGLSPEKDKNLINQFKTLSKISLRKFRKIVEETGFAITFYQEKPPIKILSFLRFAPIFLKEFFVSNAIYILKKPNVYQ